MAFEGTKIRSTRNAATPVDGSREDIVAGETIALSLVSLPQTPTSYLWQVIGRPEGSTIGGGGTNPWLLSNTSGASFVMDAVPATDFGIDGAIVVECVINKGSPLESRFSVELSRVTGVQIPGLVSGTANFRNVRKPGMFESLEDLISQPGVVAGWFTAINRFWELVRLQSTKGADLASAAQLLLNPGIGAVKITGTTAVDYIRVVGRTAGSRWIMQFASAVSLHHNTGSVPVGFAALNLTGSANQTAAANSVWWFYYDGTVVHGGAMKA